jgi:hypothetical protein
MNRRSRWPLSSRRKFLGTGAGALVGLGAGANLRYIFAAEGLTPRISPERFRKPEQGMLTLLGNPTEGATIDPTGHAKAWDEAVTDFGTQGVHLFFPHIPLTNCWKGENQYDFAPMEAVIRRTLKSDPQGSLILRLRLNAPTWWVEGHPDQVLCYADGTDSVMVHWGFDVKTPSLASMPWRRDVESLLQNLIGHIQQSDYADRVVGYHPALLHGGEWFQEGISYGKKADYSPLMEKAFGRWLQAKYPQESFPESVLPTPAQRNAGDIGHLRDPAKSRRILDYYEFYNLQFADQAEGYCRAIKEATGGQAITGFYYGYSIIFTLGPGIQGTGHLALKRVLESPHVDYVGSMLDNEYRGHGAFGWSFGPLADSARAHGKVYVAEDEARTWLKPMVPREVTFAAWARTPEEEINDLKRNFACGLSHGAHEELADLGGGWYDDSQIMNCIGRLARFASDPTWSRTPVSQIALFTDETSYFYQDESHGDLNLALINESMPEYFHIGAPLDIYLFSDLTDGRIPLERYKLIVLLNAWHVTDGQREFIKSRVQRDGRWILSFYAPGFLGRGEPSTEAIRDLIGIDVKMDVKPGLLTLTNNGKTYGTKEEIAPVFFSDDPTSQVLDRQSGTSRAAVSIKHFDRWTSAYSSVPALPADLLRRIAKNAGVHLYLESYDLVYATQGFVAIHAGEDGSKRLRLPKTCDLYDAYDQRIDARGTREFTLKMRKGDTKMWLIERMNGRP